jgi:long-chain acyl-CoA synthetase
MDFNLLASKYGDQDALIVAETGDTFSYKAFNERSLRYARWLVRQGLSFGDHVAVIMDNVPDFLIACSAALRCGLYFTPVNTHLTPAEAAYIIRDCGAGALLLSPAMADFADSLGSDLPGDLEALVIEGAGSELGEDEDEVAFEELEGSYMMYSSGTTGNPKGVLYPNERRPVSDDPDPMSMLLQGLYGFEAGSVYLCPAPLYHTAPLRWSMAALQLGGTVVLMKKFDPLMALKSIERYKVTHAQFVPTMFVRMLQLPEQEREGVNVSSMKYAVHAAAPCPVETKQAMLDWWGPVVYEYYSGTEGGGFVCVGPEEWLAHPGTVGKALMGIIHILGEDDEEVATGEVGVVYFDGDAKFKYHGDDKKTRDAYSKQGYVTLGDMGYVDDEGYLYLTDRKSHMIISGGVNIYPQEAENVLTVHPKVEDVAVIGVPHPEYGEEVKAVVQLRDEADAGADTERELIDYCLSRLSKYKCPRSVDFVTELPRLPTGKLLKRKLRDQYWH